MKFRKLPEFWTEDLVGKEGKGRVGKERKGRQGNKERAKNDKIFWHVGMYHRLSRRILLQVLEVVSGDIRNLYDGGNTRDRTGRGIPTCNLHLKKKPKKKIYHNKTPFFPFFLLVITP